MLIGADGKFLSQRECPAMALVRPQITESALNLRAPGMPDLELPLAHSDPNPPIAVEVQIWNDRLGAFDCGDGAARWFTGLLGISCRLVRFDLNKKRVADPKWTGGTEATSLFSDGYPILIISQSSLDDLNEKLVRGGRSALPMNRFRPNVVLGGADAFEEDYAETLTIGQAVLKPVKPCPRCPIPSVDQETGHVGPDPLDVLRSYRANPKVGGAVTFGMNAIVLSGEGSLLRVGQEVDIALAF